MRTSRHCLAKLLKTYAKYIKIQTIARISHLIIRMFKRVELCIECLNQMGKCSSDKKLSGTKSRRSMAFKIAQNYID